MTGIHEMFAELSGYDRYEYAIAVVIEKRYEQKRRWNREYRARRLPELRTYIRERYWNVPGVRERHLEAMRRYQEKRRDIGIVKRRMPAQHGTTSKYVDGCRCEACRAASTAYMREYRARRLQTISTNH